MFEQPETAARSDDDCSIIIAWRLYAKSIIIKKGFGHDMTKKRDPTDRPAVLHKLRQYFRTQKLLFMRPRLEAKSAPRAPLNFYLSLSLTPRTVFSICPTLLLMVPKSNEFIPESGGGGDGDKSTDGSPCAPPRPMKSGAPRICIS
jgi:hypothetical protein